MMLVPWKALGLLIFLLPAVASSRSHDRASGEGEVVVVDGDELLASADDESGLLRLTDGRRAYIGVRPIRMTAELREHFGAPRDAGLLVGEVEADSPAAKAGVRVGDIVTSAGGDRVDSVRDLTRAVRRAKAGETVELEIGRDRASLRLKVSVAERTGHAFDFGDFPTFERRTFRIPDVEPKIRARLEGLRGLEDRLSDLEKRLKDLEKRLPAR